MKVRPAYVADRFYPGDPDELRTMVDGYIEDAVVENDANTISCMVVPHAGYIFSGATAGYGYKRIQNARPSRVVLMGVSHSYRFEGISLYDGAAFDTPLGKLMLDLAFSERLADIFPIEGARPHDHEHTLETQLPFLLRALGAVPIVPILFGVTAGSQHVEFGQRLAELLSPGDIVIASTDLSHFLDEETANKIDGKSIETILAGDEDALIQNLRDETCSMCGAAAVVAALSCANARNASKRKLLDYRTSAPVSGDYDRVVGYAAISMEYDQSA